MDLDIDGATLLYALGVLFALGALVYFARDVVFALSITVKAVVLLLLFLGGVLVGLAVERGALDRVAFAVAATAYTVFVGYVAVRFDIGATGTFLLLAASAGLFVALGYGVRRELSVSPRAAGYGVLALAVVGLLLVGADAAVGGVTYTATLEETVTVSAPDDVGDREFTPAEVRVRVGTLTASNGPLFRRPLDLPAVRGCIAGTDAFAEDRVVTRYRPATGDRPGTIPGGAERAYAIETRVIARNGTDAVTVAVERASDCAVSRSEPTLLIVFEGSDGPRPRPRPRSRLRPQLQPS